MPGTSPISGWRIPLDSDPAGDLALAVRNLVDDIESAWVAYTPTFTNISIGNGVVTARRKYIGKTVLFRVEVTGGATTSATGSAASMTVPAAAKSGSNQWCGGGYYASGGGTYGHLQLFLTSASATAGLYINAPAAAVTAFTNTGVLRINGSYEAN